MPLIASEDVTPEALVALADTLASAPLLRRYGMDGSKLCRALAAGRARGDILLLARPAQQGPPCALAWGMPRGAFGSGGYLRLLLVADHSRGQGLGSLLLDGFEARCSHPAGGIFVLTEAGGDGLPFYLERGYQQVGQLPDFVQKGHTELLLWKAP